MTLIFCQEGTIIVKGTIIVIINTMKESCHATSSIVTVSTILCVPIMMAVDSYNKRFNRSFRYPKKYK